MDKSARFEQNVKQKIIMEYSQCEFFFQNLIPPEI